MSCDTENIHKRPERQTTVLVCLNKNQTVMERPVSMTDTSLAKDTRSRMTRHEHLQYGWLGAEPPHHTNTCNDLFVHELAERLATWQFLDGNLPLARKDKYEMRTRAFIRQKMDRVCAGRAVPRSDVKALDLAFARGLPIYEIRWRRTMPLLENSGQDEMIRQYCAEPDSMNNWVFGLVVHFKNIEGLAGTRYAKHRIRTSLKPSNNMSTMSESAGTS